jgi:biotin transport system substrate-specific component
VLSSAFCGAEATLKTKYSGLNMTTCSTVADVWRPGEKSQALIYDLLLILGGSLFIALSAQLAIGWPVPITMQTFAVLVIGILFGPKLGSLTVGLYLAEGLAGLPVFSHGLGGLLVLRGATGGYLVGFLAAAYMTGLLAKIGWDRKIATTILAMIIGNLIIYTFGFFWFAHLAGTRIALVSGIYPFIPGDIIKIALAAVLLPSGWKLIKYMDFTR